MSGKRGPSMSDPAHEDVLKFVQQNSCPFVTSNDVAEEFADVSGRTVRERLNDLKQSGQLECRRVGAHAKVWYTDGQSDCASSRSPSSLNQ